MDYASSLRRMARPRKRKPQLDGGRCINKKQKQCCRNKRHSGEKSKRRVWGNVWRRNVHRERNLVVTGRYSQSSDLKRMNVKAVTVTNSGEDKGFSEEKKCSRKAMKIAKAATD